MSKQYTFEVTYKINDSLFKQNVVAVGIMDAKGKIKSHYPTARIIACVRGKEYVSVRQQYLKDQENAKKQKESDESSGSALGSALLGIAAVAGAALTAKLFNNKN